MLLVRCTESVLHASCLSPLGSPGGRNPSAHPPSRPQNRWFPCLEKEDVSLAADCPSTSSRTLPTACGCPSWMEKNGQTLSGLPPSPSACTQSSQQCPGFHLKQGYQSLNFHSLLATIKALPTSILLLLFTLLLAARSVVATCIGRGSLQILTSVQSQLEYKTVGQMDMGVDY